MVAMNVTAVVERSGNWWAVRVPQLPGVFTQVRRLDQVQSATADAVAAFLDRPAGGLRVDVEPVLAAGVAERLEAARSDRQRAEQLAASAADKLREVARALADGGLPERDIGSILGVSHQRAHQLLTDRRAS
jgi:hypothetical protein